MTSEKLHPGERLAKRMARAGLCSRRQAEDWIRAGRVVVDRVPILDPAFNVTQKSRIVVDGKMLHEAEKPRLWAYYKPNGLITTHYDPEGRPTIFETLPRTLPRVISVGRLDVTSEGLLLLTNDGELSRYAELPSTGWPRIYRVRAFGIVNEEALYNLQHGITIDGVHYGRVEAELERQTGHNSWIVMTLFEGKNREIRKIMDFLGLKVNRLIRVAYGPFPLGDLKPGEVKEIPHKEIQKHFPTNR